MRLFVRVPSDETVPGVSMHFQPTKASDSVSFYLEFQLERRSRELRFDFIEWAEDVVAEVSEAHFRFVQRVMELKRDRPVDLALRTHPLALHFAPPILASSIASTDHLDARADDTDKNSNPQCSDL